MVDLPGVAIDDVIPPLEFISVHETIMHQRAGQNSE
jgi:hypothetical protein